MVLDKVGALAAVHTQFAVRGDVPLPDHTTLNVEYWPTSMTAFETVLEVNENVFAALENPAKSGNSSSATTNIFCIFPTQYTVSLQLYLQSSLLKGLWSLGGLLAC
jgi:hypothetical protein